MSGGSIAVVVEIVISRANEMKLWVWIALILLVAVQECLRPRLISMSNKN